MSELVKGGTGIVGDWTSEVPDGALYLDVLQCIETHCLVRMFDNELLEKR